MSQTKIGVEEQHRPAPQDLERASADNSDDTVAGGDAPFNFEKSLRKVLKKRDVGDIQPRELGVAFRNLDVLGAAPANVYQATLGSIFNPLNIIQAFQDARSPTPTTILKGFEGAVRPGQMLLVLGRPGSGCTTFLKTIANLRDEYLGIDGDVYYDSISHQDMRNHYRSEVQYCPEADILFPTLTVDETISFAAKTRTPHDRAQKTRSEFVSMFTNVLTSVFGLKEVGNTLVGDAAIRGVSGGQKKRVALAETLAMRGCIGAWDSPTRGLDASTALEFIRALRTATDTFKLTSAMSIYQCGESLYELFDKVCVIHEGHMAYFGPANRARQYFIDMGYEPANRQTTADFLVAVTDPNGRRARQDIQRPLPRTAEEFAQYFQRSQMGQLNASDVNSYIDEYVGNPKRAAAFIESVQAERANHVGKGSPRIISLPMQIRAVMVRRAQILKGNSALTGVNLFAFIFQGVIVGSVLRAPVETTAFFSRASIIFFSLIFSTLTSMAEIPALYVQRAIVHRHYNAALYHPFIEALALTLVDVPITFLNASFFAIILFFIGELQRSAGQFFVFFLFLFMTTLTMKAWFRAVAAVFKSEAVATAFGGLAVIAVAIYTGFTIPAPSMIGALRWIIWINPVRYAFEAMLTSELRTVNAPCNNLVPRGQGYENVSLVNQVCAVVGSQHGEAFVRGSRFVKVAYGASYSRTWRNLGILIAFLALFLILLLLFTQLSTAVASETSTVLYKRGSQVPRSSRRKDEESSYDNEKVPVESENPRSGDIVTGKGQVSPTTDVFSWQHINYTIPIKGEEDRKLTSDVSGYVVPGKLTALMGESGAGKTTLLNVLAQRVNVGVVTGDRFVNGQDLPADFQSQTGYCQQLDTHLPTATVREALLFSAKLRQPTSVPLAEKEAHVETCLRMCGLEAYGDAVVGTLGVEHRKRTTIAVELAAKPKLLLFLDEPTSGLDSQSAWNIVTFLKDLANRGQAILCTIHQPSAELFQLFDRLLLLQKGGQTVYFGDLGYHATTLIEYFERNGSRPCAKDENPAEFILDVIGAGATATSSEDWHLIWANSKETREVQREIDAIHAEGRSRPPVETRLHTEFTTSWFNQTKELLIRAAQSYWRDPTYIFAKLALNVLGGLFIGFTFYKAKNNQQGTQNKMFAMFMATILSVPLSNQIQVPFIDRRTIFEIRERPSRMYSWTAFVTSQLLVEVPWNVFGSTLLFLCWYWTVGFESSRGGYTYLMLGICFPLYYTTLAQGVAAMAPTAEVAAILFTLLFSFVAIYDGVVQPYTELHWWKWMYHLSPYTYLLSGVLGNNLGRHELYCSKTELATLIPPVGQTCGQFMNTFISNFGGYLVDPNATSECQFCSVKSSDQYLASAFNLFYSHHWRDFGIFLGYITFNAFCIYLFTYLFRIRKQA